LPEKINLEYQQGVCYQTENRDNSTAECSPPSTSTAEILEAFADLLIPMSYYNLVHSNEETSRQG